MKVAIIGAGVSGLACALELERHGIFPTVFEKNNYLGDAVGYTTIWPRLFNRPLMDPVKYLNKQYNIKLQPLNHIKRMVMYSPNNKAVVRGSLGYIFKKGREAYTLENQLYSMTKIPILFDSYIDLDDIKNRFDHIVVATASNVIPRKLGIWTDTFKAQVRVAFVVDSFRPDTTIAWLNTEYAKNAFAYLIPTSEREASLVLIVNGISHSELDYYWKKFIEIEEIKYPIASMIDAEHIAGFSKPLRHENIYIVGNSAGFTDDLLGCGAINAIESGVLAARAIANGLDYEKLAQPIFEDIQKLHQLRKAMNSATNEDSDRMVTVLGLPIIKRFIYNNPFVKASSAGKYAKIYNTLLRSYKPYR